MFKLSKKINLRALISFSFFTILSFFGAALIFNFPAPAVYGAGTAGAWNLERVGTDLNVYFGAGGANALKLESDGEMQARKIYDIDNTNLYFVDPSGVTSLNTLGIGITAPAYKLQTSSGFAKTDTGNRVISMFGSNEGTTSWGLKIAMTGAATTAASSLVLQTGDNATNNGNLGLQSYGGNVGIGTITPGFKFNLQGGHGDTQALLHSIGGSTPTTESDLFMWASEPGCSWDGAGIGNNVKNGGTPCFGRINTARGGSYMRLLNNAIEMSTVDSAGTFSQSFYTSGGLVGIGTAPSYKLHVSGTGGAGTVLSRMVHTGNNGSPGTALQVSNGYPVSQGAGNYEIFGAYADNFADRILSVKDNGAVKFEKGNIHLARPDLTPGFYGISAPDTGYFPDGTPYYLGFGREAGAWTSPFPDLLIANHTGIKLVSHGGYGGVAIYDNYVYSAPAWPGIGSEVARFRHSGAGGSYFTTNLAVNMATGPSYPFQVGGSPNVPAVRIEGLVGINGYAPGACGANYGLCVGGPSGGQSIWNNTSDVRLKENINTIPNALEKVMSLRGVYFNFKDLNGVYQTLPKGRQVGFIAQEVEPILPEVVSTGSDGMKMMGYGSVTALLTEAAKELNQKLEKQQSENKQLRDDLELLKKEIQLLKEKK